MKTVDLQRGLTILITTYNASSLIQETLKRLSEMDKVEDLPWEVLIVDNNSTDDTLDRARKLWKESAELRIVNEPQQGTGYAIFRGMSEAKYAYIGIVDQDNWVHSSWMRKAVGYLDSAPRAAMICAKGTPVFETTPPKWFDRFQQSFAVGPQSTTNGAVQDINRFFYNAGSILRKAAFADLVDLGFTPIMQSRVKNQLLSGDDTELQILLRLRGWEVHYQDDIMFEHFMPAKRLHMDYFRKFRQGLGATSVYLDLYRQALKVRSEQIGPFKVNWKALLRNSLINLLKDPLAVAASLLPRYASNYRVAKYWSRLGEFRERFRLKSELESTQRQLIQWLESFPAKS